MLYGAMNFPVRPILKELEAISELKFDYLYGSCNFFDSIFFLVSGVKC
jgi:hypothetical protein